MCFERSGIRPLGWISFRKNGESVPTGSHEREQMQTLNQDRIEFDLTNLELDESPFFSDFSESFALSDELNAAVSSSISQVKEHMRDALCTDLPFSQLVKKNLFFKPNIRKALSTNQLLRDMSQSLISLDNTIVSRMRDYGLDGAVTRAFFNRLKDEISRNIIFKSWLVKANSGAGRHPRDAHFDANGYSLHAFSGNTVNTLNRLLSSHIKALKEKETFGQHRRNRYDRATRFSDSSSTRAVFSALSQTLGEEGLGHFASIASGSQMALDSVTLHISRSDDKHIFQTFADSNNTSPILNMHLDPKWGHIKALLYLEDCELSDGPFSFVPRSHCIEHDPLSLNAAKANSVTNYLQTQSERAEFAALPKALRSSALFGSILGSESRVAWKLKGMERPFAGQAGTCIIFNPFLGFHRGGQPMPGRQRVALQIIFRPTGVSEAVHGF